MMLENTREIVDGVDLTVILVEDFSNKTFLDVHKNEKVKKADDTHFQLTKEGFVIYFPDCFYQNFIVIADHNSFTYNLRLECADMISEMLASFPFYKGERRKLLIDVYSIINETYLTATEDIIMKSKPDGND